MRVPKTIFTILVMNILFVSNSHAVSSSLPHNKEILQAIKKAVSWLSAQQVPNKVVPKPVRKNFILSYKHDPKDPDYKYIYSKSSLYDNALAIIAFSMVGNDNKAFALIQSIKETSKDGHFYFNYNTNNMWPNVKDRHGAVTRNGASAWMGYAIAYFLKLRVLKDKKFKESKQYKETLAYLVKVIEEIKEFEITSKKDPRQGLIRGGYGQYKLEINKKTKRVSENFYDRPIEWVSIEHCMDFYFLLKEAVALGLKQYEKSLEFYKKALVKNFWNEKTKQFNRGYGKKGKDEVEALDASSWGALYLYSIGDLEKAIEALGKAKAYENWEDPAKGHRPYINVRVYEDYHINKHYYPKDANKTWNDLPISWYEGTFGVVLAELKVKGVSKSLDIQFRNLIEKQNEDGSFVYATKEIPFQFSNKPSVASTAWFIIAASSYLVPELRESFWP